VRRARWRDFNVGDSYDVKLGPALTRDIACPDASAFTTFLFAGIEGSIELQAEAPDRMRLAMAAHDGSREQSSTRTAGRSSRWQRWCPRCVPRSAGRGSRRLASLQQRLADPAATADIPLRLRCGIHLGEAGASCDDYFGATVNRAQRVMEAGARRPGCCSRRQRRCWSRDGCHRRPELADLGNVRLRDLGSPSGSTRLVHPSLRRKFPPLFRSKRGRTTCRSN
jgi:class 3 adenylate cyclase